MTFSTLCKPTQPFNTLQEHTTTFFSNFERSRMQVFTSFCKVLFYLFFRFIFFVFVFFIFINLFIPAFCENLRRFLNCKNTNPKWRFGALFIFLFSLLTFLFFVYFLFFLLIFLILFYFFYPLLLFELCKKTI